MATLLLDTETSEERNRSIEEGHPSIPLSEMARRILTATEWLREEELVSNLPIGYLGSGTGAAATLMAAAKEGDLVRGVVTRGGRLELCRPILSFVRAPILLIVGARDTGVVHSNRDAYDEIGSPVKRLEIIPGARHLFDEPGALAAVAMHAGRWLAHHLPPKPGEPSDYAVVVEGT
ncbi:MAG TPA: hypothetical protein VG820_09905 [Fimbriimonadaceae bacterium]|nr:hypothetical protein [Fimbriimonadaceae bacterium]